MNTSLTESFGIAILEAACAGLYVVSTRVGGVPEILPEDMISFASPDEDGRCHIYFKPSKRTLTAIIQMSFAPCLRQLRLSLQESTTLNGDMSVSRISTIGAQSRKGRSECTRTFSIRLRMISGPVCTGKVPCLYAICGV